MLLTITTTRKPAADLSYLLHKHPAKVQEAEIFGGTAHIFYPEVSDEKCTVALLLDIDPVGLVRRNTGHSGDFALEQYVNDRPYTASSFLAAAIAKVFSTAMNGRCKDKPELVNEAMPFEAVISALPVRGGEAVVRQLFEPLGHKVELENYAIDPQFPAWGQSRYFTVRLRHNITLQQLLSHLYILIPVCDNDKHYWVGEHEVEKLLEKGKDWLPQHPAREFISIRYLKHKKALANKAIEILQKDDAVEEEENEEENDGVKERKQSVHDLRLQAVRDELLNSGAKRVADLGCGEGKLLRYLLSEKQFEEILGMDVSYRTLEIAKDKLKLDRLPQRKQDKIKLIQGSLTYRDQRIEGYDAAALVEVIEHLDEPRLAAMERAVFEFAKPRTVIITTPNKEYNVKFEKMEPGKMRHSDHRFEWTRAEFQTWGYRIATTHNYHVSYKPVGEEDPEVGSLTQMAIFSKQEG